MHSCSHVDVFTEETRIPILALAPVARSTAEIRRKELFSFSMGRIPIVPADDLLND